MNIQDYSKIIIVGSAGSGKSWLGKKIAEMTGFPLTHLDNEYWKPNWVKTPRDEWISRQNELMAQEKWIIEGNYNSTMELRYTAADLVIFLDISRITCIIGVFKRHGKKRSDLPEYLEEKFDSEFWDFNKWIWDFPKKGKKTIMDLHEKYPDKPFLVLKSRRQAKKFISEKRFFNF